MADVCDDGKAHGLLVESLCPGRAPNPSAIPKAGTLRDAVLNAGRAVRKQFAHPPRKPLDVFSIKFCATLGFALATTRTRIAIG